MSCGLHFGGILAPQVGPSCRQKRVKRERKKVIFSKSGLGSVWGRCWGDIGRSGEGLGTVLGRSRAPFGGGSGAISGAFLGPFVL